MNTTVMIALLIIGATSGFPLGQWWAEINRARHDMKRTWESRTHYRRRD